VNRRLPLHLGYAVFKASTANGNAPVILEELVPLILQNSPTRLRQRHCHTKVPSAWTILSRSGEAHLQVVSAYQGFNELKADILVQIVRVLEHCWIARVRFNFRRLDVHEDGEETASIHAVGRKSDLHRTTSELLDKAFGTNEYIRTG